MKYTLTIGIEDYLLKSVTGLYKKNPPLNGEKYILKVDNFDITQYLSIQSGKKLIENRQEIKGIFRIVSLLQMKINDRTESSKLKFILNTVEKIEFSKEGFLLEGICVKYVENFE